VNDEEVQVAHEHNTDLKTSTLTHEGDVVHEYDQENHEAGTGMDVHGNMYVEDHLHQTSG